VIVEREVMIHHDDTDCDGDSSETSCCTIQTIQGICGVGNEEKIHWKNFKVAIELDVRD
jgi:hypothetical protein